MGELRVLRGPKFLARIRSPNLSGACKNGSHPLHSSDGLILQLLFTAAGPLADLQLGHGINVMAELSKLT